MVNTIRPMGAILAGLALLTLSKPVALTAQDTRQDFVTRAVAEPDPTRQRELLQAALDPALGPGDSIFGVAAQYLAQNFLQAGQDSLASVWLKWAIRYSPGMQPDTLQFPQSVVSAYRAAQEVVSQQGAAAQTPRVDFAWPTLTVGEGPGSLRVSRSAAAVTPQILVRGVGLLNLDERVTLGAGTYTVEGSAAGYLSQTATVEILPGVTTIVAFNLAARGDSVISGEMELNALDKLVRITAFRLGQPACGTGFIAGADGLVLTTYRTIRGAENLQVEGSDGVAEDVRVAAYDASSNVAVVTVPFGRPDSLPLAEETADRSYVWALTHPDCGTAGSTRTRLLSTAGPTLRLEGAVVGGEQGGPLIDNSGSVVGLGTGSATALRVATARAILDQARRNLVAGTLVDPQQVAMRENHLYGRVDLRSSIQGATASVTPMELWQWAATARTDSLPFVFTGPMGRYSVDLMLAGELQQRTEMQVQPGQLIALSLALPGGGSGKTIGIVGGLGVAGLLAALVLGGGGDGPPVVVPPTVGSITIFFPHN